MAERLLPLPQGAIAVDALKEAATRFYEGGNHDDPWVHADKAVQYAFWLFERCFGKEAYAGTVGGRKYLGSEAIGILREANDPLDVFKAVRDRRGKPKSACSYLSGDRFKALQHAINVILGDQNNG